jgi:hypothetical protein
MYFALVREEKLNTEQPRVYFSRNRRESRAWGELFKLDRNTEASMCRDLGRTLGDMDLRLSGEYRRTYGQLKPDVWIQDGYHAIIIENKDGGPRSLREAEYLSFLNLDALGSRIRYFLYSVPHAWLPNPDAEWWQFTKEKKADDKVHRGIIPWDDEFVNFLCSALYVPEWYRNKLPNRVDQGKYLGPGQQFWD